MALYESHEIEFQDSNIDHGVALYGKSAWEETVYCRGKGGDMIQA